MTTEVLNEYNRDEILRELFVWTGRELSPKRFYAWLPYVLIDKPKDTYTRHEVCKFLFVSSRLYKVRSLEKAREKLAEALDNDSPIFNYQQEAV